MRVFCISIFAAYLLASLGTLAIFGCGGRPSFWEKGDVYVVNNSDDMIHWCTVAGTLLEGYPSVGRVAVFDRNGSPVKCRWMTQEDKGNVHD